MGNQMFMYAAGLALSQRLNTELKIDRWQTAEPSSSNTVLERPYHLGCFPNITEADAALTEIFRIAPGEALLDFIINKRPLRRWHILRRLASAVVRCLLLDTGRVYHAKWGSYSPEFLKIKDNTFIKGYWESEDIFKDIAELVRHKFTFKEECFAPKLSAQIKGCNSVAVHVRMTDKANKPYWHSSNVEYICNAVEKITSLTHDPKFFVFSDDIDYCRKTLPNVYDTDYTFIEDQTPPQDMALMTLCKHVITAPSTFSWWGAWLNNNPNKIIIAPSLNLWYPDYNEERQHLLPSSWIKIS